MRKMKRFLAVILSAVCLFGAVACTTEEKPPEQQPLADNSGMVDSEYNLKTYLYPIWEGKTVYNETLWFAGSNVASLLYMPDEVLSVKSYDLSKTYVENRDYVIDNGSVVLTANSEIPYLTEDELYPNTPPNSMLPITVTDGAHIGKYIYANEGPDISNRQVVVTYTHSDRKTWTMPRVETTKFPKTIEKLEKGEPIRILFYGDSITVGANSSEFLMVEPHAESYANMVKSYIAKRYPEAQIEFKNNAVGGTDSNWGNSKKTGLSAIDDLEAKEGDDHFGVRVLNAFGENQTADLLFIAYGMNDQDYSPNTRFRGNIAEMIEKVRALNPDVEIMLISGMIANPETGFYNKDYEAYQQALSELTEEYENVGLATTLSTVLSLYKNGKRFLDCTANNVNHPNDFMMRIYAQTVVYSLFGADYIDYI